MRAKALRLADKLTFGISVTTNMSQRIARLPVHRPASVTFNLSQLGGKIRNKGSEFFLSPNVLIIYKRGADMDIGKGKLFCAVVIIPNWRNRWRLLELSNLMKTFLTSLVVCLATGRNSLAQGWFPAGTPSQSWTAMAASTDSWEETSA